MGCGGSKLDPNNDDIPDRLKPILQCRLEEIRAKKSDDKNANDHSKKELLGESTNFHESNHEEVHNHEEIASNCDPTFQITQDSPPTLQKISVDNSLKLTQEVKSNVNDDCEIIKPLPLERSLSQCGSAKMDERRFLRKRHMSEGSFVGRVDEITDLDDSEQGDLSRGSPSFRVYCTDVSSEGDDHFDDHDGEEDTVEDQRYSISQESSCSNEVSVKHIPAKKGRRGRMFKITMPKGGKLYKNMQSLYNFPCASQANNTHLLQKAAA